VLVATVLLVLHLPGGDEVYVNPMEITTMRQRAQGEIFTPQAECMVSLVDGKFVTVVETCHEIRRRIEEAERPVK
jgi:uncharacterized protein YlzI (FlbEa/FlbD family)